MSLLKGKAVLYSIDIKYDERLLGVPALQMFIYVIHAGLYDKKNQKKF